MGFPSGFLPTSSFPSRQVALSLLRQCAGFARMVFYMRVCGHAGVPAFLRDYDAEVDATLRAVLGYETGALPEAARVQAALPVRAGGLGVPSRGASTRRRRRGWCA